MRYSQDANLKLLLSEFEALERSRASTAKSRGEKYSPSPKTRLAEHLGISGRTLRRYLNEGVAPPKARAKSISSAATTVRRRLNRHLKAIGTPLKPHAFPPAAQQIERANGVIENRYDVTGRPRAVIAGVLSSLVDVARMVFIYYRAESGHQKTYGPVAISEYSANDIEDLIDDVESDYDAEEGGNQIMMIRGVL